MLEGLDWDFLVHQTSRSFQIYNYCIVGPSDIYACKLEIFVLGFVLLLFSKSKFGLVSQEGNEKKEIYLPGYFSFGLKIPKNKLHHEKSSVFHEKPMKV